MTSMAGGYEWLNMRLGQTFFTHPFFFPSIPYTFSI